MDTTLEYDYDDSRNHQRFKFRGFRFFNNYESYYIHCELLACHFDSLNSRLVDILAIIWFLTEKVIQQLQPFYNGQSPGVCVAELSRSKTLSLDQTWLGRNNVVAR